MRFVFALITILCGFGLCSSQDWKAYPYQPSGLISFPLDEGRHTVDPTEWWYTSGHVLGLNSGTNYSFMCTFFYNPAAGFDGFRILNITNDDTGEFFQSVLPLTYSTLSQSECDIEAAIFQSGTEYFKTKKDTDGNLIPFEYELFSNGGTGALDIEFETTKRPLILSQDGYLDQGFDNYTYYYSQTMNTISGSLTFNGITEPIFGTGWIDRQYGDFNPFFGEKYEWFSMQLSNGMDINCWNVFTVDRTVPNNERYRLLSAYVDEDNQYSNIDLTIERLEYFCLDERCYSKKWHLTSSTNAIDLIIEALHTTTEVQLPFRFFEGSTVITGIVNGNPVTGKGFAELLHMYENPSVLFTNPSSDVFDSSVPISWTLSNPDEGRPVYYDLEYSIDNQESFNTVVSDLENSSYLWENPPISQNDELWLKLTARSVDGVLSASIINGPFTLATLSTIGNNFLTLNIFSNPVESTLRIVGINNFNGLRYSILDINGRKVSHGALETNSVEVSQLKSGLYFCVFENDSFIKTLKFVKQ